MVENNQHLQTLLEHYNNRYKIHNSLGQKRIKDCFLVDIDFLNESFVVKAIKCLTNFINKDCSSKPWNRHEHFSEFIKPKKTYQSH